MPETNLGHYRLVERLGSGGMGEVFLAQLEREDGFVRRLVVKRILPELSDSPRFREMFANEARIAASLHHPHIVQVTDYGSIGESCFLAIEHIDGTDLATLLERARKRHLPVPLDFVAAVGLACLRALDYAHRLSPPVIHGDVSPSNLLVGRQGECKLADFGLARLAGLPSSPGRLGEVRGKLPYLAPEAALGQPPEPRSDLFGAGAILYELLTGVPPLPRVSCFEEALLQAQRCRIPNVTRVFPEAHPALARIIERALAANVAERFGSASAMEEDLLQIVDNLRLDPGSRTVGTLVNQALGPGGAETTPEVPRTLVAAPQTKSQPRRSLPLIGLVAGLLAILVGALVWFLPHGGGQPALEPKAPAAPRSLAVPIEPKPQPTPPPVPPSDGVSPTDAAPPVGFSLRTNRPASYSLDGQPAQPTPIELPKRLGETHLIKLTDDQPLSVTVRIEPRRDRGDVRLAFQSEPFAILSIDGKPRGLTPLGGISVSRGTHAFKLDAPGLHPLVLKMNLP